MLKFIAVAVLLFSLFLTSCSGPPGEESFSSSLVIELSLEELVAYADWIVTGAVTKSKSSWDDERANIYTYHTITVEDWVKGSSPQDALIIKVPGGRVGFTTQRVEDAAGFQKGEMVLVFLSRNEDGTGDVVGGFQGKYTVGDGEFVRGDISLQELILQIKGMDNQ